MRLSAAIVAVVFGVVFFTAGTPTVKAQSETETTAEQVMVEIKPGDSLSTIANQHQTTFQRLFNANLNIKDPDLIYPGDTIRVPAPDEQLANRAIPVTTVAAPSKKVNTTRAGGHKLSRHRSIQPVASASAGDENVWDRLAQCESGGNWSINTGNGYSGGLQFSASSWRAVGGSGSAHQASREEQIARAKQLQARQGWGAWPACTRKLGIR